jgi:hypothetical protein
VHTRNSVWLNDLPYERTSRRIATARLAAETRFCVAGCVELGSRKSHCRHILGAGCTVYRQCIDKICKIAVRNLPRFQFALREQGRSEESLGAKRIETKRFASLRFIKQRKQSQQVPRNEGPGSSLDLYLKALQHHEHEQHQAPPPSPLLHVRFRESLNAAPGLARKHHA